MNNKIVYTHRYLAKYWLYLIHDILIDIETKYLKKVTDPLSFTNNIINKQRINNNIISKKITILLDYIEEKLNTNPKLLIYEFYYNNDGILLIPIKKNNFYNVRKYYQRDLNHDVSESALLIKIDNNNKFTSIGLAQFPKNKYLLKPNVSLYHQINETVKTEQKIIHPNPELYLNNKKEKNNDYNRHKCFYSKDYPSNNNDIDNSELYCKNNGGFWDAPCKTDIDCPFNKGQCNINTGMCSMPFGIKPIGFTYYDNIKKYKPNCIKCNKYDFDTCCDSMKEPEYKYI